MFRLIQHTIPSLLLAALLLAASLLTSCRVESEPVTSAGSEIQVGGITTEEMILSVEQTRASSPTPETTPAEQQTWLIQPLKRGLDITYGLVGSESTTEQVAILQLQPADGGTIEDNSYKTDPNSGYAVYSFNYRSNPTVTAKWYGNGPHYFQGVHVPKRIRYSDGETPADLAHDRTEAGESVKAVVDFTSKQNDDRDTGTDNDLGNYTLLSHYLGMPANTRISATVGRILLPFRHRLAHVNAYILIDPALGASLRGFELDPVTHKDNPETTDIKFCNVQVLAGVKDTVDSEGLHTLTPSWKEERKVIPHYLRTDSSTLEVYKSVSATYFPGSSEYNTVQQRYTAAYNKKSGTPEEKTQYAEDVTGYKKISYSNFPVYDVIVRPTYTSVDNVMYDEDFSVHDRQWYANQKNHIFFELGLDNGLTYTKNFEFDLDANYETTVYLQISREGVDYNESGSDIWKEHTNNDDWYGIDNENGNTLSKAGSSWQRAYTTQNWLGEDKVTDGGFYNENTPGEDGTPGQYLYTTTWINYFLEAYKGGAHHGDYFALLEDITIDASRLPIDFVFTGHLDAFDYKTKTYHTITLSGGNAWATCDFEPLARLCQSQNEEDTVPQLYWMIEVAQAPARRTGSIPVGTPVPYDMATTLPPRLTQDEGEGKIILYEVDGKFVQYSTRTFYRKTAGALFTGLDGIYTTAQELAPDPYDPSVVWEANVHKETRDSKSFWLPYKDDEVTNTGWRAEVLNLRVISGNLFTDDAVITGNVENCQDASGAVEDHTPAIPKWK